MEISPEQWAPSERNNAKFTFLAVEPQNERPRLSAGVRKQMKSHLTHMQHKRTRQERADKISSWLISSLGRRNDSKPIPHTNSTEVEVEEEARDSVWKGGKESFSSECGDTAVQKRRQSSQTIWQLPYGVLEQSFSRGSMAFRAFALGDPSNVVGASLGRLNLDVGNVLSFYHTIVQFQASDFERQFSHLYAYEPGYAYEYFVDLVLRDPIPLTTAILITVRHMVLMKPTPATSKDLYHEALMRGYLVHKLNAALDDPVRSVSDQLLAAVALLAIYEVKYGNIKDYHVHMKGLTQMVALRGGIDQINRESNFLGRFILWQDINSSTIAACDKYFDESKSVASQETGPKADPKMFTLLHIHEGGSPVQT